MRKIVYFLVFVVFSLSLIGCNKEKDNGINSKDNYTVFLDDYDHISKNFKPTNFEKIGEGELQFSSILFPENNYFDEKNDLIDEDLNKPVKKNLYYINKDHTIMIYITHIYLKNSMGKSLITSNVPANEYQSKSINIPYFEEYYMSYRNTLVSLKVINVCKDEKTNGKYADITIETVQEYINMLK